MSNAPAPRPTGGPDPDLAILDEAVHRRTSVERWSKTDEPGGWCAQADDGRLHGEVRRAGGHFEARVYRRPTGPHGPEELLAHGPQVFEDPDDALDYVVTNLGFDAV